MPVLAIAAVLGFDWAAPCSVVLGEEREWELPLARTVFAGYTIQRILGRGGMGTVYLARHPRLARSVALKILDVDPATDTRARAAFDREAALAASLDHPNIVPVHDRSAPGDPELWLAIRYIDGGDLCGELSGAPTGLDPARAVRLSALTEICWPPATRTGQSGCGTSTPRHMPGRSSRGTPRPSTRWPSAPPEASCLPVASTEPSDCGMPAPGNRPGHPLFWRAR